MKNILFIVAILLLLSAESFSQWVQTTAPGGGYITSFAYNGTNIFVGTYEAGIFLSTNNGTDWTPVTSGVLYPGIRALATIGTNLFAGTWGGMYLTVDSGKNWTSINAGLTTGAIWALIASGTNLFAGTDDKGVFLSTNNGTSWTEVSTGLTNLRVRSFALKDTNLFAGTDAGVFRFTNNGTSWTEVNTGLTHTYITALIASGTNLFAGTSSGDFCISTDNGDTWNTTNFMDPYYYAITSFAVHTNGTGDTLLFAGDAGGHGVFLSTNNGASWAKVRYWVNCHFCICVNGIWNKPLCGNGNRSFSHER